jgi:Ni/Co efflux regulator RcnB
MKRLVIALLAIVSFSATTFAQKQEKKPVEKTLHAKKEKAATDTTKHVAHKAHSKKAASEKKR